MHLTNNVKCRLSKVSKPKIYAELFLSPVAEIRWWRRSGEKYLVNKYYTKWDLTLGSAKSSDFFTPMEFWFIRLRTFSIQVNTHILLYIKGFVLFNMIKELSSNYSSRVPQYYVQKNVHPVGNRLALQNIGQEGWGEWEASRNLPVVSDKP